jgi:hypothetical protein
MPGFSFAHPSPLVCIPGERPDALDSLRTELAAEHRPATATEELLVDEMAQNYWRMKRYRYLEASMWMSDERGADGKLNANLELVQWTISSGIAAHYHRCLAAAERAFYKALNTLRAVQKERGFVFSTSQTAESQPSSDTGETARAASSGSGGFVFSSGLEAAAAISAAQTPDGFVFTNCEIEPVSDSAGPYTSDQMASFLQATSTQLPTGGFVFSISQETPELADSAPQSDQNINDAFKLAGNIKLMAESH